MGRHSNGGIIWHFNLQDQSHFSQIEAEFGDGGPSRLGKYRTNDPSFKNEDVGGMTEMSLDTGIPKSGSISFLIFMANN